MLYKYYLAKHRQVTGRRQQMWTRFVYANNDDQALRLASGDASDCGCIVHNLQHASWVDILAGARAQAINR